MYFYMEHELTYKKIAVIGCGAAGGFASVLLCKNPYVNITAFDLKEPFSTLLPTGGGRCNLTYDETDIRDNKEGAFSILKNDIYSLVESQKEQLKNTQKQRDILADYMSDISHQLKTPITSLGIGLDNLSMCADDSMLREK